MSSLHSLGVVRVDLVGGTRKWKSPPNRFRLMTQECANLTPGSNNCGKELYLCRLQQFAKILQLDICSKTKNYWNLHRSTRLNTNSKLELPVDVHETFITERLKNWKCHAYVWRNRKPCHPALFLNSILSFSSLTSPRTIILFALQNASLFFRVFCLKENNKESCFTLNIVASSSSNFELLTNHLRLGADWDLWRWREICFADGFFSLVRSLFQKVRVSWQQMQGCY